MCGVGLTEESMLLFPTAVKYVSKQEEKEGKQYTVKSLVSAPHRLILLPIKLLLSQFPPTHQLCIELIKKRKNKISVETRGKTYNHIQSEEHVINLSHSCMYR